VKPDRARASAGAVFALLLACALLAGCGEKARPPVVQVRPGSDIPDQESWNATITFTDSGRVGGILRAGYIGKFLKDQFTLLDSGIVVDFYNDNHEHTSVLTARRGKVNDVTNDFEARGDVVVRSDSGTVLRTEELFWNNKKGKVTTEAYVEIVSPTEEIRGTGLESDQSLTHYTIKRVTGKAQPK
jgi:LPS export ABC transporter protein LptC